MALQKSYNKKTDTTYVYETEMVFDPKLNKNVEKRKCIGKLDETGQIIPTGKRGRPPKEKTQDANVQMALYRDIAANMKIIVAAFSELAKDFEQLGGKQDTSAETGKL